MKAVKTFLLILVAASFAGAADDCRLPPGWKPDGPSVPFTADHL